MDRNYYNDELIHFGIKGMKWGVRRYQNADGSLKPAGEKRYTTIREASKKARAEGVSARKAARESGQLNGIGAVRKGNKIQREATKAALKEIKKQERIDKAKVVYKQTKEKVKSTVEDHTGIKNEVYKKDFRARRKEVAKSRTAGAKAATFLLGGPFANRTYNSVIAAGGSKVGAVGMTAATAVIGGPIGHLVVSAVLTNNASEKSYRD